MSLGTKNLGILNENNKKKTLNKGDCSCKKQHFFTFKYITIILILECNTEIGNYSIKREVKLEYERAF